MAKGIKTGGRTKGTVNKVTPEIRNSFENLLSNNLEQLQNDIDKLKPYERIKILIDIAKFVVPQLKAIELTWQNETKERPSFVFIKKVN